jgi:hypothetical protein
LPETAGQCALGRLLSAARELLPPNVPLHKLEPSSGLKVSGHQAFSRKEGFMSTLENLRKSARRWLKALRADDTDAHARLKRADPNAPSNFALRDVQHALAREHGHRSWVDLRRALNDGKRRGAATPMPISTTL